MMYYASWQAFNPECNFMRFVPPCPHILKVCLITNLENAVKVDANSKPFVDLLGMVLFMLYI